MMSQIIKNPLKMPPKSIQNLSKTDRNGALGAFSGILGAFGAPGRFQDAPGHQPGNSKVDLLAEMVAPRVDSGTQLGRKGDSKSPFGAPNRCKIVKK